MIEFGITANGTPKYEAIVERIVSGWGITIKRVEKDETVIVFSDVNTMQGTYFDNNHLYHDLLDSPTPEELIELVQRAIAYFEEHSHKGLQDE